MAEDWTEKYRPKVLKDVVGNPGACEALKQWAIKWQSGSPSPKVAVLMGPPGIGKTTSAHALANEMGWQVVEMNASDQRKGEDIQNIAIKGSGFNTFGENGFTSAKEGKLKLIILDEADSFSGNQDRGAIPAINTLIRETRQPVLLIVNDYYALTKKSNVVRTETLQIQFKRPQERSMVNALKKIAANEGLSIDDGGLEKIAANANGDMRAAVRDLESVAIGSDHISSDMTDDISARNVRKDMFAVVDAVFRKNDPLKAKQIYDTVDTEPGEAVLWIDENLPYEYKDQGDIVRGTGMLSRADIFLGRVRSRQHYGFWSYASELAIIGVSSSRKSDIITREKMRFPSFLSGYARSKASSAVKRSICRKLGILHHMSSDRCERELLPVVKRLCSECPDYRLTMIGSAELNEDELGFLMGKKSDSAAVKNEFKRYAQIIEEKRKQQEKKEFIPPPKKEVPKPPEPVAEPVKKAPQRSLFDF